MRVYIASGYDPGVHESSLEDKARLDPPHTWPVVVWFEDGPATYRKVEGCLTWAAGDEVSVYTYDGRHVTVRHADAVHVLGRPCNGHLRPEERP